MKITHDIQSYEDSLPYWEWRMWWEPNDYSAGECIKCGSMKTRRVGRMINKNWDPEAVKVCKKCGYYDYN